MTVTIHVELLDENVNAKRPVQAEHLGGDLYRLEEGPPDDELWPFALGDVVRCKEQTLHGDFATEQFVLVAYERIPALKRFVPAAPSSVLSSQREQQRHPTDSPSVRQPDENTAERTLELAPSSETESRRREVQLLINIAEPDPEYQPFILTDEASLLDSVMTAPEDINRRLYAYFGGDLRLDFRTPIWQLVDQIKSIRPGWPDDPEN